MARAGCRRQRVDSCCLHVIDANSYGDHLSANSDSDCPSAHANRDCDPANPYGGVLPWREDMGDVPACWTVYFTVEKIR